MEVCAASNILTVPLSSCKMRPFAGSTPIQLPVKTDPLKFNFTLWPSWMLSFDHCVIIFLGCFSAIFSQCSDEVISLLANEVRSQVVFVSMSMLVAVFFSSSGNK